MSSDESGIKRPPEEAGQPVSEETEQPVSEETEQSVPEEAEQPASDTEYRAPHTEPPSKITVKRSAFSGLVIGLVIAVGVAAFLGGTYVTGTATEQMIRDEVQKEVARVGLGMLGDRLPGQQPQEQPRMLPTVSPDDDPVMGNPDAPITIIEFSDFQCPFCARFYAETLPQIEDEYILTGKAKLVYRDFPLGNIHPNTLPAAVASECADEQGKFKEMHDALFENQSEWGGAEIEDAIALFVQYASAAGMESESFESCITQGRYIDEVSGDLEDGRAYGVTGTPAFFVGNERLGYAELKGAKGFEAFRQIIDAQLAS